ncbi:MAG: hypothetical protein NTY96_06820, partial [Bacteroidetes bacterium]|nr:hypothetical protein [Bacteroidota bacterium]
MTTSKLFDLLQGSGPDHHAIANQGPLDPDAVGGDVRGANATDFQFVREAPARVASGANSFIGGGEHNLVSGANSFAAAGSHNELEGPMGFVAGEYNSVCGSHASALGTLNQVLGNCSHALGTGHTITSEASFAEGDGNIVSGYAAHAEGSLNICDGSFSHAEGMNARAYNDFMHAFSSGGFANPGEIGEAQYSRIIARIATEDDSPCDLRVGEENSLILMNNKMNAFRIMLVASSSDLSKGAAWELKGLILKHDSPSSTSFIGTPLKTLIASSNPSWNVTLSPDTENGSLR